MNKIIPEYCINQLMIPLGEKDRVLYHLARLLRVRESDIAQWRVERMSLDLRRRGVPHWSCQVVFRCARAIRNPQALPWSGWGDEGEELADSLDLPERVCVVGAGPAGLWAALSLARKGYQVELHEQGLPVEQRYRDIRKFLKGRVFNPRSNVLFGEGGAGAFSDGKLTSRTRGPHVRQVLDDLARASDMPEVRYLAKPHIGTDRLFQVLRTLRGWLKEAGVELYFDSKLTDLDIRGGSVRRVAFDGIWRECEALVLAVGHSARDIFALLFERGVALESKPFALGVRVEHPQEVINRRHHVRHPEIGALEYVLTAKTDDGTSAYSFCMCPGGVLIPCASEEGGFATNGMSYSRRNGLFANAGIVVPVEASPDLWGGLNMQRTLERRAFELGGKNYTAPAQRISDFLDRKSSAVLPKSSFPTGLVATNHWEWLGEKICEVLAEAFVEFEKKIPGWIQHGLMVSPETRTSSPVRISRLHTLRSANVEGLYPLGEGAGYAGGIVTSAADGVRLAYLAKTRRNR